MALIKDIILRRPFDHGSRRPYPRIHEHTRFSVAVDVDPVKILIEVEVVSQSQLAEAIAAKVRSRSAG